jgi:DNA polymerase-3 subunit beta
MKIHINPKDFSPKFRLAASVATSRDIKPVLQNVKITADKQTGVVLQATDAEIGIRIRVDGDVVRNGVALLPKERLLKVLDLTREEMLTLEFVEDKIVINGEDKEHYALDTLFPNEFPDIEEFGETAYHVIPAKAFQEIVSRTVFAVDPENVRYALGGVCFDMTEQNISIVATDGRRLAWQESTGDCINNHTVETGIVSVRTLQLLNKALGDKSIGEDADVKMAITGTMVRFQCQDITLFSRRVEGRYPQWRNIIPETENKTPVIVECDPLLSAILQAQVTISDYDPGVKFLFEKGKLTLQGQGKERGNTKIEIPLSFSDAPKTLKFDPKFMTDFLKALDANAKVSIYLPPDNDPAIITADDGGYVYVVMPMSS